MKLLEIIERHLYDFSKTFFQLFCIVGVSYLLIKQGENHLSIVGYLSIILSALSIFLSHKLKEMFNKDKNH